MRIKPGTSWFPAMMQWQNALAELSDGAFKLFVYLCLNADRETAKLNFCQTALARTLGKSRRSLGAWLKELENRQMCRVTMSCNQHSEGTIQIQERFWPYEAELPESSSACSVYESQESYIQAIQSCLKARPCVSRRFSNLDRRLAQDWFQKRVELRFIERSITLACGRKYVSWLNGAAFSPIGSLRYFEQTLEEVLQDTSPSEYWDFNKAQVQRLEQKWLSGRAWAKFSQAKKETR